MNRRSSHRRKTKRRDIIITSALILICLVLLAAGITYEKSNSRQQRGTDDSSVGQLRRIEYDGTEYIEKPAVTTILLLGIDDNDISVDYGARRGGQADFQLLLVIDHEDQVIHQLQIDRDTITDVEALGIFGNTLGLQPMQICLAHAFGASQEECDTHAVEAVERMLPGLEVDVFLTFDLASIGIFNDALGGITVTLEDDFSASDPTMTKGATLTLSGDQAEIYVRTRMEIGDGTNASRMSRHRTYLSKSVDALKIRVRADVNYLDRLLDLLEDDMTVNVGRGKLINEANRVINYELLPIETLEGVHTIGKDGYVEFHLSDNAAEKWILEVLYEPCR